MKHAGTYLTDPEQREWLVEAVATLTDETAMELLQYLRDIKASRLKE